MSVHRCIDSHHPPTEHYHVRLDVADGRRDGSFHFDPEVHDPIPYSHSGRPDPVAPPPLPPLPPLDPGYPKPAGCHPQCVAYSADVTLTVGEPLPPSLPTLRVECDYCNTVVATFAEAERTIAERVATEHGGYHR